MPSDHNEQAPAVAFVTGGAGFIGSNFIRSFLSRFPKATLVNLDLLTYAGNLTSLEEFRNTSRYEFVHGDIGDKTLVRELLSAYRPTLVFNFAAESHVDRSIDAPDAFIQTNVVGTANMLHSVLGYWDQLVPSRQQTFRFLHVSTDEVYGSLGPSGKFTEATRYQPNSPYSASKAASDHLVRAYQETYGLPTLISNCSNNYGPRQFPEKLIPLVILNALEGKALPVYGDGANVRDWLFVTDHCDALIELSQHGRLGEVYNIGGDAERTNLEVVHTICQIVDELCPDLPHRPCSSLIEFVTDRPGHDRRYAIDATKIHSETSWKPSVTFDEGIRQTVHWYLENRNWVETVSSSPERDRQGLLHVPKPFGSANSLGPRIRPREFGDRPFTESANRSGPPRIPKTQAAEIYVDGEIHDVLIRLLQPFSDERGWLIELFRHDEIASANHPKMAYVSETQPGVTRGPHEHAEQADYFAFLGPSDFELSLWDSRPDSPSYGKRQTQIFGESNPATVIVPPGVVHAYKNLGQSPGWVFNAPNRLFAGPGKREPVDEIRHEDQLSSPYQAE